MQRKRAIAQLCNLKEHCNEMAKYNKEWESDVVALDIAIKALKKSLARIARQIWRMKDE